MPEEISSVPWTLPITLEVIVNLQEVLNRVGTPDVLLRVPLTLGDQRLLLSISSHIIASIDVSGKSPLSVHESGRVALEMLIASDVYRRLSVLLDIVLELTRNDPAGYTQQRLPQSLVEILRLNYPWTLSDTSRHFAFEVSEIGLRTSISVKALLIGIGLTVGSISPVVKCIDDAVKVANDLKQGIEMVLHVPETKAYRETMAKDFRNQMEAEAKRHNFHTLQSLLQQQGWDPGLIDGILGSRTAAAAAQFAKANGLSPSLGPENPALWEALSQAAAAHLSLPVH